MIPRIALFLTTLALPMLLCAQSHHPVPVLVRGATAGSVLFVQLLDPDERVVHERLVPVTDQLVQFTLDPVPPGRYAVRFFQDENANRKLDLGMFGIPKEGVGASRDATGFMSAPKVKDMLFDVPFEGVQVINVKRY